MKGVSRFEKLLAEVQHHLRAELLPFWASHGKDPVHGGFLTYFDRHGAPTGETTKTLLGQARMIYTASSVHRAGLGEGRFLDIARQGVDFLVDHFWDDHYWGWYWTCRQDGTPLNTSKLTYGHAFAIYGLSEYAMASGDHRAMEWAVKTFEALQTSAADACYGGYWEFFERGWTKKPPGRGGGDRKSLDVHMHLMEALTNLYEATGVNLYKTRTTELITLILSRMLHPEYGTGIAQFRGDWTPVRQILFSDVWGSDREADDPEGRPLDNTSYGHNVEFAWLLNRAVSVLGLDIGEYGVAMKRIYDHCCRYGIDWERGGVYCDGLHDGPARERNKEFWQQAECLVGMLDAYLIWDEAKYIEAYENVHRFVMDHVVNHEVGEWYPLLDEENRVLWDYMGHAWKTNYHTVRAMIESEARLLKVGMLPDGSAPGAG